MLSACSYDMESRRCSADFWGGGQETTDRVIYRENGVIPLRETSKNCAALNPEHFSVLFYSQQRVFLTYFPLSRQDKTRYLLGSCTARVHRLES